MPGRFTVLSSQPTLNILGGGETEDAQQFVAQATQSGSVFTARIPLALYEARDFVSYTDDVLEGRAVFLDILAAMPEVASVGIVQGVTAGDQLQDALQVTVVSASGRQTFTLPDIPFPTDLSDVQARIAAKAGELNQLEGV